MAGKKRVRVVSADTTSYEYGLEVVYDLVLEYDDWPEWRFVIDLASSGDVVRLVIRPTAWEQPPAGSIWSIGREVPYWDRPGITSSEVLRKLPFDALVREAQRYIAKHPPEAPQGIQTSGPLRDHLGDVARDFARKPGPARKRTGRRGEPELYYAVFARDYTAFVSRGGTVADFREQRGLSKKALESHQKRATELELYEPRGNGKPGGRLTEHAKRILEQGD